MHRRLWHRLLFVTLVFNALTAIVGGASLVAGINTPPEDWLQHTPFTSYVVPGLLLSVVVGGSALLAAAQTWAGHVETRNTMLAELSGIVMVGWIIGELLYIREFSWLQVVYVVSGLAVITLSRWDGQHKPLIHRGHLWTS